jgi:23S rRNA (uracil1939-C5)-methyltransferase
MKLELEKAIYGGACLAHQTEGDDTGKTVFVPFTLPGEIIEASLIEQRDSFEEASLDRVLTASQDRVQPKCSHFGQCGGCHYQHAAYPAQVRMKEAILRETLKRTGLKEVPAIQTHSSQPWAYRSRARLRLIELGATLRAGYNQRGSNQFLAIHECPILAPLLWRAIKALLQVAEEDSAAAQWLRNAVEVELFTNSDETSLQMTLFVRKQQTGFGALCERMKERIPELTGAGVSLLPPGLQRRSGKPHQLGSWGAEGLVYRAADEDYWVSRGGFFQTNRFLVDELVRLVTGKRTGTIAWDLYAGVGLFSRALAKSFRQVVAVEASANELSTTFRGQGRRAVEATTVAFLRGAVVQRERPELIVVDPPRAGLGAEVCGLLVRVGAPEIVYVSCDPVTLARDLKSLAAAGYIVTELHMIDMFPQTFHLETVVVLRR